MWLFYQRFKPNIQLISNFPYYTAELSYTKHYLAKFRLLIYWRKHNKFQKYDFKYGVKVTYWPTGADPENFGGDMQFWIKLKVN